MGLGLILASACGAPPEGAEHREATGTAAQAIKQHCFKDGSGELVCYGGEDPPQRDTCTIEYTPLPSPDPLAAAGLTHCGIGEWLTEPAVGEAVGCQPVLLWTCDPPAPGVVVPSTIWPEGWKGQATWAYGMVKGHDGAHPSCTSDVGTDALNMCEIDALNSDCYGEPEAGQVVVAMWVGPSSCGRPFCPNPNPSSCRGLCRTN
jgi:hypothetical protein